MEVNVGTLDLHHHEEQEPRHHEMRIVDRVVSNPLEKVLFTIRKRVHQARKFWASQRHDRKMLCQQPGSIYECTSTNIVIDPTQLSRHKPDLFPSLQTPLLEMRQSHYNETYGWDRCRILRSYPNVPVVATELRWRSDANWHFDGGLQLPRQRRNQTAKSDLNITGHLQAKNKCWNPYIGSFCPRPSSVQFENPQKIHFEILYICGPSLEISSTGEWKTTGDPPHRRGQVHAPIGIFYRFSEILLHIWVKAGIL